MYWSRLILDLCLGLFGHVINIIVDIKTNESESGFRFDIIYYNLNEL